MIIVWGRRRRIRRRRIRRRRAPNRRVPRVRSSASCSSQSRRPSHSRGERRSRNGPSPGRSRPVVPAVTLVAEEIGIGRDGNGRDHRRRRRIAVAVAVAVGIGVLRARGSGQTAQSGQKSRGREKGNAFVRHKLLSPLVQSRDQGDAGLEECKSLSTAIAVRRGKWPKAASRPPLARSVRRNNSRPDRAAGSSGVGEQGLARRSAAFGDDNPFLADSFDRQHLARARQPVAGTNFVKPAGAALHERYAVLDLSQRIIADRLRGVGGFGVRAAGRRRGRPGRDFRAGSTAPLASVLAVAEPAAWRKQSGPGREAQARRRLDLAITSLLAVGTDDLAEIAASSRPMDLSFFSSLASICAATLAASA